jgi:hypothetical protein
MSSDLSLMRSNLQEIYSVVHQKDPQPPYLVANLCGTRLYDPEFGWGRFWSWCYNMLHCFTGDSLKLRKISQAMQVTDQIFKDHLPEILNNVNTYKEYLQNATNGYPVKEGDYFAARYIITLWNDYTRSFLKLMNSKNRVLVDILTLFPGIDPTKDVFDQPFKIRADLLKSLYQYQNIIDLEGWLGGPLPLETMTRVAAGKKVAESDLTEFRKFAGKVDKIAGEIDLLTIHRPCRSVIEHALGDAADAETVRRQVGELELKIYDSDCTTVFKKCDPKHDQWRKGLQPGDQITINDKVLILKERIGAKAGEDLNHIYNLAKDQVALIGFNRAILSIKDRMLVNYKGSIPVVQFLEVDARGRCAVMEKLCSLDSINWTTTGKELTEEDRIRCEPILNQLRHLVEIDRTPTHFAPRYLGFDKQGQLKCLRITQDDHFNFVALEDFVYKVSKGNKMVFKYIMQESGLTDNLNGRYLQLMVTDAIKLPLNEKGRDAGDVGDTKGSGITDSRVVDHAKLLCQRIREMKVALHEKLKKEHAETAKRCATLPSIYENAIRMALTKQYTISGACGTLWHTMEGNAFASIVVKVGDTKFKVEIIWPPKPQKKA